jgi:hypothetical protein
MARSRSHRKDFRAGRTAVWRDYGDRAGLRTVWHDHGEELITLQGKCIWFAWEASVKFKASEEWVMLNNKEHIPPTMLTLVAGRLGRRATAAGAA